jgi:pyridoxal 5'-phosphate synthase pdxS subunit
LNISGINFISKKKFVNKMTIENGLESQAAGSNGTTPSTTLDQQKQQEQWRVKVGLAEMLKGGVIMDVMNGEQARIAQEAGAVAVMALERIPALIRQDGGVARMSDPAMIEEIKASYLYSLVREK